LAFTPPNNTVYIDTTTYMNTYDLTKPAYKFRFPEEAIVKLGFNHEDVNLLKQTIAIHPTSTDTAFFDYQEDAKGRITRFGYRYNYSSNFTYYYYTYKCQ
jgi:hypothetical protein